MAILGYFCLFLICQVNLCYSTLENKNAPTDINFRPKRETISTTTKVVNDSLAITSNYAVKNETQEIPKSTKSIVNETSTAMPTTDTKPHETLQSTITVNLNMTSANNTTKTWNNVSSISDEVDFFNTDAVFKVPNNMSAYQQNEDYHVYYNSTIFISKNISNSYWKNLKDITHNNMLSTSHRKAVTLQLSFDFPFYGHLIRNVTVATGGFLYTGDYVHSWLAATQYIAPLMANFDTSLSNASFVKYFDNGTSFTVLWENVYLQDKMDIGSFTFSATLYKNGNIVFFYYNIPILIESIQDDKHPVKVGLSDAYIIDKVIFFSRRKTIYEYHRVNFGSEDITNSTIIQLTALPTCLGFSDCDSCLSNTTSFQCLWCHTLNRCSTGTDRKRHEWLQKGCDQQSGNTCSVPNNKQTDLYNVETTENALAGKDFLSMINSGNAYLNKDLTSSNMNNELNNGHVTLMLSILVPLCMVVGILIWVLYAFRNPHTKSGQLLIQYRPSQWSWKRGEARYTAATIHM